MKKMYVFSLSLLLTAASAAAFAAASPGEKLFQQKCKACHKVQGVGGTLGPDLTGIGAKRQPAFLSQKLDDPKKSNPTSTMPAFKTLPPQDKKALVDYLKTLK